MPSTECADVAGAVARALVEDAAVVAARDLDRGTQVCPIAM